MFKITMTTESYLKKPNRKTAYFLNETERREISQQEFNNISNSAPFFRRLGGSVTQQRAYTCCGFNVIKDISTSPDKERKTVRKFQFEYQENA